MPGLLDTAGSGASRVLTTRALLFAASVFMFLAVVFGRPQPAQAAIAAFTITALLSAWVMSRGTLASVSVEREHRPRVFENDVVGVKLVVRQSAGLAQTLVQAEDLFFASLGTRQRHLIPMMSPRFEAHLHYIKQAERHRGLYMLGPVRLWASDPLGVFFRRVEADCVTRLTVYPKSVPLPGYRLPGPDSPAGPGMEKDARVGQAEEIIGVRLFQTGDSLNRIHWRTSARRGQMHTIEVDRQIQSEITLFMDLSRSAQYGTGGDSTIEIAIGCACSILTEAAGLRHRVSMVWLREGIEMLPAGTGLAHLHMLLDQLAVVEPAGEYDFWPSMEASAALLPRGARAIFITPAARTAIDEAEPLIRLLALRGVAVDVILIDEASMTRVWRGQLPTLSDAEERFDALTSELELAGARVMPLRRGQAAPDLLPRAGEEQSEAPQAGGIAR